MHIDLKKKNKKNLPFKDVEKCQKQMTASHFDSMNYEHI